MDQALKKVIWMNAVIFPILSVGVFFLSYSFSGNGLSVSLFGLFFVLLMGIPATILDYKSKVKEIDIWIQAWSTLALVNIMLFVIWIPILSGNTKRYLVYAVSYSLIYLIFTFIRARLNRR